MTDLKPGRIHRDTKHESQHRREDPRNSVINNIINSEIINKLSLKHSPCKAQTIHVPLLMAMPELEVKVERPARVVTAQMHQRVTALTKTVISRRLGAERTVLQEVVVEVTPVAAMEATCPPTMSLRATAAVASAKTKGVSVLSRTNS